MPDDPYYGRDLALIHHLGFGFHANTCAPGILRLLEPVRERGGLVLEIGCGSGLLTKYLVDAGHRVVATDASPAMLDLARETAAGADVRRLTLPDDPLPEADAIVGVGHALNYLPDVGAIERGLAAVGERFARAACSRSTCATSSGRGSGLMPGRWAGSARTGRSSPSSRIRLLTGSSGRWRRSSGGRRIVAARRRAPRERPDRDRSRARAARGRRRRGERAAVVRREELPAGLRAVVGHRTS